MCAAIEKIGIVAGGGALPLALIDSLKKQDIDFHIVALNSFASDAVKRHPHTPLSMGQVGRLFQVLKKQQCTIIVMAGHVARPNLKNLRFDVTGLKILFRMAYLLKQGDNTLLSGIASLFEQHGFRIGRVQDYLQDCLAPAGVLGRHKPSVHHLNDMQKGKTIVEALSQLDLGQAAVVEGGICQALEAAPGTDNMLLNLARTERKHKAPTRGVLYKAPKTDQDMRLDIPTIGPQTIENAHKAGLAGVAVKANNVFVLHLPEAIALADQYNMFIYGLEDNAP